MTAKDTQHNKETNNPCRQSENLSPDVVLDPRLNYPNIDLNASTGDPTDGRKRYHWVTGYPAKAKIEIRLELIYLSFVFFFSLFLLFATWMGWITSLFSLTLERSVMFKIYAYYAASGMLGGITFSIKYFYRVVARGYWHQDRRIWRLMSPLISMVLSLIIGAMINASMIETREPTSGAAIVSIGFLVGYFADHAIGKMYDIANVLLGPMARKKAENDK